MNSLSRCDGGCQRVRARMRSNREQREDMNLRFGLGLDGYESASAPCDLGSLTCGPLGLLDVLETRLGLKARRVSQTARVLQFKSVLEEIAAERNVFYAASLAKDPLAVAATLLGWRDGLIEAGWNGSASAQDCARLQDLATIEVQTAARLAPGRCDRLATVVRTLESRSAEIESLTVFEDREHLATLWTQLCDKLGAVYKRAPEFLRFEPATPGTDLASIQASLANAESGSSEKLHLRNDGSLICLTAHSEVTLGRALAQWLANSHQNGSTTLVAGEDAIILESALLANGEAALGRAPLSCARPIPQVLLLALRLRWGPIDPRALLEFLTHPVCPVTRNLRKRLADAVAASPGMGGPKWNEAIEWARNRAREQPGSSAQAEASRRIDEDMVHWLMGPRFGPAEGAPGEMLSACCARVARWAGSRGGVAEMDGCEREQFLALASLASELADLLGTLPSVTRVQLEGLLREAISNGWAGAAAPAELGHAHCVSSPAALIEPADSIFWWDFNERRAMPRLPWTTAELRQLKMHGADFPSPEIRASQATATWIRPVLAARKRLILATPRQRAGEPVARHPLHSRLLALLADSSPGLLTQDVDAELASGRSSPPVKFIRVNHRSLPQLQRWWKLSCGRHLSTRDKESYSSLEKFIYSPYAWVLSYKARLRAGPLSSVRPQNDSNLKGTLLHRLLEVILAAPVTEIDWQGMTQTQLAAWLERRWQSLLEQEGANLLLPGRVADGAALLESGKNALWELFQQMRAAKVSTARTNIALPSAKFFGGQIEGIVDLLVKNQSGQSGVIDLKLGGREMRGEELAENRPLQLAIYGYLLKQETGSWPAAAFFILTARHMMSQANDYFPTARIIQSTTTPTGLSSCWADFEEVWRWRRQQLDAGWIEVTADGTDPDNRPTDLPDPAPPLPHWQATEKHAKYNDFDALTGWRADA